MVIEALCSGRPVVATHVGGIPELVDKQGHSGILVPPRDAPALADALISALSHPWDHRAIAARHQRSWRDVAQELLSLCETLVGRPLARSHMMRAV